MCSDLLSITKRKACRSRGPISTVSRPTASCSTWILVARLARTKFFWNAARISVSSCARRWSPGRLSSAAASASLRTQAPIRENCHISRKITLTATNYSTARGALAGGMGSGRTDEIECPEREGYRRAGLAVSGSRSLKMLYTKERILFLVAVLTVEACMCRTDWFFFWLKVTWVST